jgi:hypothetical protein
MYKYENGNTIVTLLDDGSKIREHNGNPNPLYPESIDLKITNYCDLFKLCQFCHEGSNKSGAHANLDDYYLLLEQLPSGAELAIGGGNPLSHPDLVNFLEMAKKEGIVCNLTVNEQHLKPYRALLTKLINSKLIYGVGISVTGKRSADVQYICDLTDNVVFHVIMGVHDLSVLETIKPFSKKVLILGYKHFRKGNTFFKKNSEEIDNKIYQWYIGIPRHFNEMILSFDNLAIKQLEIKRWFTEKSWEKFYMGDDGTFTMYIDAVNNKFSTSSTSLRRHDVLDHITDMFDKIKQGK